jgi:hypothetical protein
VEHQVERPLPANPCGNRPLDLVQELGPQLHVARLVHPVDVAEGRRQQVAAPLPEAEQSLAASAKPRRAALSVSDEVTLTAG